MFEFYNVYSRLEEATVQGVYDYWLTQEDIADIARIEYHNYENPGKFSEFEIIGSETQLHDQIQKFINKVDEANKINEVDEAKLTLIINVEQKHWVLLLINYHEKEYETYYIDSLGSFISESYQTKLDEFFKKRTIDLSSFFLQQTDSFNCGLWTLENAHDLTEMIVRGKNIVWLVGQLLRPRNTEYFSTRRTELSNKLKIDPSRIARLKNLPVSTGIGQKRNIHISEGASAISTPNIQPDIKKKKESAKNEIVNEKLEFFVQKFIENFSKRLVVYHLTAKHDNLSVQALKNELTTGFIGSLLGVVIARNIAGSAPSLVASIRALTGNFFSKKKAKKITKLFSEMKPGELSKVIGEAAIAIFQSYEKQFMLVTDASGHNMALEKLAEDASERALNYCDSILAPSVTISTELITTGIIQGKSEAYFDPNVKKARVRVIGRQLKNQQGKTFSSANFYEKVGLLVENKDSGSFNYYKLKNMQSSSIYGFRRLLSWEKDSAGMLKAEYKEKYIQEPFVILIPYEYKLSHTNLQEKTQQILSKISSINHDHAASFTPQAEPPKNILFNLRKPIKNFSGRIESLNSLHQLLSADIKLTVILSKIENISLESDTKNKNPIETSNHASVTGLGGIGKTQLALKYAQTYASSYDNNILWIDAEKKLNIASSFKEIAISLDIGLTDALGNEKEIEYLINDIYHFFSKSKSLFIFDNAENYRELEFIFPKVLVGNYPTILITSRYRNWINIATIFPLEVFTEIEATNFLTHELLIINGKVNTHIRELAHLLQNLPLALQQAVAYIQIEKNVSPNFNVKKYIDLFKEKSKTLLSFDFSIHSNDPYSKTIFTTWKVTLEKLKEIKIIGDKSVEILSIMAYLYSDKIDNRFFIKLQNKELLGSAIKLLKDYSMINEGTEQNISTIHRLTQYVLRINLESNNDEFKKIVHLITDLTSDFKSNRESMSHYLTFLLHMSRQVHSTKHLFLRSTSKKILHILSYYEEEETLFNLTFDEAYLILPRKKFLDFIHEALLIYTRAPFLTALNTVLNYLEKKINEGKILIGEAKAICLFQKPAIARNSYTRFSAIPEVRSKQYYAGIVLDNFVKSLFLNHNRCSPQFTRLQRDLACLELEGMNDYRRIDNHGIKKYLKNLRLISNYVNTALLTKDTLLGLIQGDFESVATTFSLLTGGVFFGKISNKLLIKSEELLVSSSNKFLLEEELNYEGKLALSIFSDEKILLAGKRRFLANGLKISAPFVSRGTSVFFAYNFLNALFNNQTDTIDTIANGGIVTIDLGSASVEAAEYLGYLSEVSVFTGPIGEGISLATVESLQFYHTHKQLSAIEKWVHLSDKEIYIQSFRAFFNMGRSEYLDAKIKNNQQVNKTISFLKQHQNIQRYVFSAWRNASALYQNQVVFLDAKRNIRLVQDEIPNEFKEGFLFCLSGEISIPDISSMNPISKYIQSDLESLVGIKESPLFSCKDSIGVEFIGNRTDNITLLMLHEGNDLVFGSNSKSIHIINDGEKRYNAGHDDDLFILIGNHITGELQGNLGDNIVKFSNYHPREGNRTLLDMRSLLCGTSASIIREEFCDNGLKLSNITQIYGRENKQDTVFLNEKINSVDTYEGESKLKPDYIIITENASKNITITLRPNTVVFFHGRNITNLLVNYKILPHQVGDVFVRQSFNSTIVSQFYFNYFLENLSKFEIKPKCISLQLTHIQGKFNIFIQDTNDFPLSNSTRYYENFFIKNSNYFFDKNLNMKVTEDTLYIRFHTNISDDNVLTYARLAKKLDKAMLIKFNTNETIFIGKNTHNVLITDGSYINHLIGNADQNVYVIKQSSNSVDYSSLKPIYIHNLRIDNIVEVPGTLILSELFNRKENFSDLETAIVIREDNNDLILTINANYIKSLEKITMAFYETIKIVLKNAMVNYWFQDLDIILDKQPMAIVGDETAWRLVKYPLVYEVDKNIIVISEDVVKYDNEFFILKDIGQYEFFRYNNRDLYLTNLLDRPIKSALYTVVFSKFFQNGLLREKILKLNVNFLDESIIIGEHTNEIDSAEDFNDVNVYRNETIEFNRTRYPRFVDKIDEKTVAGANNQFYFDNVVRMKTEIFDNANVDYPSFKQFSAIKIPLSTESMRSSASIRTGIIQLSTGLIKNSILSLIAFTHIPYNNYYKQVKRKIQHEESSSRKTEYSAQLSKKETNQLVYCNKNNFFSTKDCIKNQSSLGLLGYCTNTKQTLIWFYKNTTITSSIILWFAIAYNDVPENIKNNLNKFPDVNLSLQTDQLYFSNKDGCSQLIDLNTVSNINIATLFPYLPEKIKQLLLKEWSYDKKIRTTPQNEFAMVTFKQQSLQIGWNYIGNVGLLHSFVGDYFQALGLRPNWQEHDPSYFLARWLNVIQQLRLGGTQISTIGAALLETAILQPKLQQALSFLLPNTKNWYKKQTIRFFSDLLQWGGLNFALMPSILEIFFSDYLPAEVTYGLRAVLSFYSINNDLSYYYLGIALFLLPQLPLFLEYLGIPVTTYVLKILEKLTQLFIFQSLLEKFRPTPDESRLTQCNIELQAAEQRVVKGNERVIKPLGIFFKSVTHSGYNFSKNLTPRKCMDAANINHKELTIHNRNS